MCSRQKLAVLLFILGQFYLPSFGNHDSNRVNHKSSEDSQHLRFRLRRILRDLSGHFHPELHGDKAQPHFHSHSIHVHSHNPGHGASPLVDGAVASHTQSVSVGEVISSRGGYGDGGYGAEPPPPIPETDHGPAPPAPVANCGCVEKDRCGESVKDFTELVIRTQASLITCGTAFQLCCYDDPWQGYVDPYIHLASCVSTELCQRSYGSSPTDVRDYGAIAPCIGLGTVRCLDGKPLVSSPIPVAPAQPVGPTHIVIPIAEPLPTPVVPFSSVPSDSYGPPPPAAPIPEPPAAPIPEPPSSYGPPAPSIPEPPSSYGPPAAPIPEPPAAPIPEPPSSYGPPAAPIPEPPSSYGPPAAQIPEPPSSYGPPAAQIPEPPSSYGPPPAYRAPTPSLEAAVPVIPSTSYGVPEPPAPYYARYAPYPGLYGYNNYYPGYGLGFRKSFGFSKGLGGFYPGYGLGYRKHFGFSKGLGFYG